MGDSAHIHDIRCDISVIEHDAFGIARRSGGEKNHRQSFGIHLSRRVTAAALPETLFSLCEKLPPAVYFGISGHLFSF